MHRDDRENAPLWARESPVFRENAAPRGISWAIFPYEWLIAQTLREIISQNLTTTNICRTSPVNCNTLLEVTVQRPRYPFSGKKAHPCLRRTGLCGKITSKARRPAPLRPAGCLPQPRGFLCTKRQSIEQNTHGWRLGYSGALRGVHPERSRRVCTNNTCVLLAVVRAQLNCAPSFGGRQTMDSPPRHEQSIPRKGQTGKRKCAVGCNH